MRPLLFALILLAAACPRREPTDQVPHPELPPDEQPAPLPDPNPEPEPEPDPQPTPEPGPPPPI